MATTNADGNTSKKARTAQTKGDHSKKRHSETAESSNDKGWTIVKNPYKKVQSNSANRRLCTRGPSLLQHELTPDRNNRALGTYNHRTRVTVKLTVAATDTPQEAILNAIQEFFDEFQSADSDGAMLPWKRNNISKGRLDGNKAFPQNMAQMRVYTPRLFTGKKDSNMTIYP